MHAAHFATVPFENLNIQRGVPIVTDHDAVYDKIVRRRRGGFCLELSSLFAWALGEIGFQVDILGGRVLYPDGTLTEPLSHMSLRVEIEGDPWLADVGFGGRIQEPLRWDVRAPQVIGERTYGVAQDGDHYLVTAREPWQAPGAPTTYVLTHQPRAIEEFDRVCHWLQTSPESNFTRGDLATLGLPAGRVSYAPGRLILTGLEDHTEIPVAEHEVDAVLQRHFGIDLSIT
jgi:N-hydroxyarylamine O-acetyltransferase